MAREQRRVSGGQGQRRRLVPFGLIVCILVILALAAGFLLHAYPTQQVVIHVDGQDVRLTASRAATVQQALAQANITLGPQDRVSPPLSSSLASPALINITRVSTTETTRRVPIPYNRQATDDPRSPHGFRQIMQPGVAGVKEIRERVTTEDGVETQRTTISEQVIQPPVAERLIEGSRDDPALDAFREAALAYLGRGGVTRLSASVVEQTMFELARLRGDRYGSVRVLTKDGRNWLVLSTFSRAPDDVALFVFWWGDELHAYTQVLSEGISLIDARAQVNGERSESTELGLVVSPTQGSNADAPQFRLLRLPPATGGAAPGDTWQTVWSSETAPDWRSSQGTLTFSGDGLDRLTVRGASSGPNDTPTGPIVECTGCPHRRFESIWQRQGDAYVPLSQTVVPSPYATLWAFVDGLHSGNVTATLPLISDPKVITSALGIGLGRPDLQWTVSGKETDPAFNVQSSGGSGRVTLEPRGAGWVVTGIGPAPAQGKILFTGTRPVVRGMFAMDAAGAAPVQSLGDGQHYVWSPDYTRIAYDWQGLVYVANADGGNERAIGAGAAPAWSADGTLLALERQGNKGSSVVVVDVESGQETVVASGSRPAWSPQQGSSGQRLAYQYNSAAGTAPSVYLLDPASGASSLLASDGREPLWSPDGSAIVFLTSDQDIAVVTLAPGGVHIVAKGWGYTWSPDGKQLAFLDANPAGKPMIWDKESDVVKALVERTDVDGLAWSSDGKQIVFSLAGGGGLWLVGSDGSNPRKLGDGRDPVWSASPRAGR